MSKSPSKLIVSPDYRKAPASVVETIIGGLSLIAMMLAVVFGAAGEVLIGFLMFIGAIIAYVTVTIQRAR